ncbi:MAG: FKBP-type peptidyl-prolyl cis-trans isomerase [Cellvibrionaceae bacterium]|nr:FKBP-type peptidyl-prolyl cis-trans isomerase [Cellvibrionaceae bacterium]
MNDLTIGPGTQVTLHFALELEDGSVVDSNFDREPVTFVMGDGNLLPGFEEALLGLQAGDEKSFVIPPEKGFGPYNPENIQEFRRVDFPTDVELAEGLVLSFADAQSNELPGVIQEFDERTVTVDFNHPLAGRDIEFSVRIIDVNPAVTH